MDEKKYITKNQLINEFLELGLKKGDILNLKISLKSIGRIQNGAETVIDALLEVVGKEGTLVTDSFIKPYPSYLRLLHTNEISTEKSLSYAGAITNTIIKRNDVYRASHPIQRFAAVGKHAKYLTENFTIKSEPYGFLKEMAMMGAKNIRIGSKDKVVGVGTTHVAICELRLQQLLIPRGVYYINDKGKKEFYYAGWANGCPNGFNNLIDLYRSKKLIISEGMVGNAEVIITSMKSTLEFEIDLFSKKPNAFLCDDPTCTFCSFTWVNSEFNISKALIESLKTKRLKTLFYFIKLLILGKYYPK